MTFVFMPDSSVTVPATLAFHPSHASCREDLRARAARGDEMILAAHSLAELYSTLTRIPPPNRMSPAAALSLIRANYLDRGRVVALDAEDYVALLAELPALGVAGGRVYDAIIARTADRARVDVFVTRNVRDFAGLLQYARIESPAE